MLAQRGCPGIPVKPGLKSGRIANDRHAILNVAKNGAGVISVKIDDELHFGAGLNGQYLDAKLTNAVDFGSVCLGTLGPSARPAISSRPVLRPDRHPRPDDPPAFLTRRLITQRSIPGEGRARPMQQAVGVLDRPQSQPSPEKGKGLESVF